MSINSRFVCFVAYVDDRDTHKATSETWGKYYAELEHQYFKTVGQTAFFILNEQGKVLAKFDFSLDPEKFLNFLEKGIS